MKRHATCFVEKAWFEPRTLGTKAERYNHCATRQVTKLTPIWARTFACKFIVYLAYSDFLFSLFLAGWGLTWRATRNDFSLALGFSISLKAVFWNLPFASVRLCKFVMDRADIPEDEWTAKRDALAAEHNLSNAREQLTEGIKAWLQTDMFQNSLSNWCLFQKYPCNSCGWLEAVSCQAAIAVEPWAAWPWRLCPVAGCCCQ